MRPDDYDELIPRCLSTVVKTERLSLFLGRSGKSTGRGHPGPGPGPRGREGVATRENINEGTRPID